MSIVVDNLLGLRLPQQSSSGQGLLTRPKEMEAWIAHLPIASARRTARQLFRALHDLNRAQLPPRTRFQLAELLAKPIGYVLDTLENRYIDALFPLSEKRKRTASVCIQLTEELAFSYKQTVHDVATGKIGSAERKLLVLSLFHSVRYLTDVIYRTGLVYQPPPIFIWRELHNLFTFAETHQWASTRIKTHMGTEDEGAVTTFRDLYLRALLFAMAGPSRLRQREIRTLYRTLPQWGGKVHVAALTSLRQSTTRFIVYLKRDQPPQHTAFANEPVERPALELDTAPLIQGLRERLDGLTAMEGEMENSSQDELSRATLWRLMQAWGTTPRRQYIRTQLNFELTIAVGLSTIYAAASGAGTSQRGRATFGSNLPESGVMDVTEIGEESTFSSKLLEMDSELTLIPLDHASNYAFLRSHDSFEVVTEKEKNPRPPIWTPPPATETGSPCVTLRTPNESAGGYCVDWTGDAVPGVKVGELVSIQAPAKPSTYAVAVVRWMRDEPQRGVQVGLQLLAPAIVPVTASIRQSQPTPIHCLLVPERKNPDRPANLITPATPFRVGERLFIHHGDTERRVRLVQLLDASGAFAQFQFDYE